MAIATDTTRLAASARFSLPTPIESGLTKQLRRLRYTEPCSVFYRIPIDDQILIIVGDGDNGAYEWVLIGTDGGVKEFSNCGYGQVAVALRDGLIDCFGFPQVTPTKERP